MNTNKLLLLLLLLQHGGTSLLHLGSAVALGVIRVHCVSFE